MQMEDVQGAAAEGGTEAEDRDAEAEAEPEPEPDESVEEPSPGAAAAMLEQAAQEAEPPSSDPTRIDWAAPETVLTLHGYFRLRTEFQNNFFLSRPSGMSRPDLPFSFFRPIDRSDPDDLGSTVTPAGGCRGEPAAETEDAEPCGQSDKLRYANMRLRLRPTISLSDDVRVHAMFDVFDNLVLGSTPEGTYFEPPTGNRGFVRQARNPQAGVPIDSFATTQDPPTAYRNSLQDSIVVRRAWAEVTNRGLGQLRFGRMGSHWGLGLLANDGSGIDSDFQTDVDRIMGITKFAGFYFVGAWDWAGEGVLRRNVGDLDGLNLDATRRDDIRQLVVAVARRMEEEDQKARLQRGDWVLNGGFYFVWRKQDLSSAGIGDPFSSLDGDDLVRRDAKAFIPDLWLQFLWKGLRLEAEAVSIFGEIRNLQDDSFQLNNLNLRQFGFAVESEYRLLDDKLGISFYTGYATGDGDVNGLSDRQGFLTQASTDDTASTMRFHQNYRIDLILFRNILGRVQGAYYFRPGISYDVIRNPFGQLLGARADLVYSRASKEVQSYGSDPNLGVELDLTAYYRSEDGPGLTDGFYAQFQYGILFPLAGLGYPEYRGVTAFTGENPSLGNAQTVRFILGVQF
jgi:uncharacterized protein (TIGR04551 family)